MAELMYDETVGWYDPDVAFCSEACGRPATHEVIVSMGIEPSLADMLGDGGAYTVLEARCDECE